MMVKKISGLILFLLLASKGFSQTEVQPWGNIMAIRIDGQPVNFESSLRVVYNNWSGIHATGRERQRPKYERQGAQQIITTAIDSIHFTEIVEDGGKGTAKINIQASATANRNIEGVFFALSLPDEYNANATVKTDNNKAISLADTTNRNSISATKSIAFIAPQQQILVTFNEPTSIILKKENSKGQTHMVAYLPIQLGDIAKGQTANKTFTIKASGTVDNTPVNLVINTAQTGRAFDGLGGNFRLQNPKTDPQVIDYCLENLRVAWARVEMPWRFWQPDIGKNPMEEAKAGRLDIHVQQAMEMAQRLHKMGIPIILSAWSPPAWAVVGTPKFNPGPDGVWGNPLDHTRDMQIYQSIASYITYLKEQYGVEINMFSFNESDLGINIRQTGEEHAKLIKELGAYFASSGLKTKMLLGDNSDATTYQFIYPAMNDTATHKYIGAISFHSWRGWEKEILQKWADAATTLSKPLLIAEGSIDAAAWNYPAIFEEPIYAMDEINLYTRLLAICQPASILQWQLTADYSPLAGGGIFGNNEPLHPTQRFWNLKQLSSTPKGLKAMPIRVDKPFISAAALGDNEKGIYAVHIVNRGATRTVYLSGLPPKVKTLRIYVTDTKRNMQEGKVVVIKNGKADFKLDANTYTTLISK